VCAEYPTQAHTDIGDAVANQREQLVLEILLEQLFLVHGFTAHKHEVLSTLKSRRLKEVLFDDLDNGLLLLGVVIELFEDVNQTGRGGGANLHDMIIAKFEEHRQKAVIDCFGVEELSEFAQILCKYEFHAPFVLGLGHAILVL